MRLFYKIAVVFLIGFTCNAQISPEYSYNQGQRFIRKAERKIKAKDYIAAEKLLDKALKSNLGYCGIGTMMEEVKVYNLKAKIYREQKKYEKAIALLDSVSRGDILGNYPQLDCIRVEMLIEKYGKKKVREAFSDAVATITEDDFFCKYYVELLSLNYSFSFVIDSVYCGYERSDDKEVWKQPDMKQLLKQQPFYTLLE